MSILIGTCVGLAGLGGAVGASRLASSSGAGARRSESSGSSELRGKPIRHRICTEMRAYAGVDIDWDVRRTGWARWSGRCLPSGFVVGSNGGMFGES